MKVSDYIVKYLIDKGISDAFGYPGGMVTHLMESFSKYQKEINAHVTYHEQGAAFAACGYAQASGKTGVAYATSGPGATNLITGICNAYFDSIPVIFITGNVNIMEVKGKYSVRQRGFQETDVVSMVSNITKYVAYVDVPSKIKWYLDYAFYMANTGRKGPVLLDIPMNIFRMEVEEENLVGYEATISVVDEQYTNFNIEKCVNALNESKRPVLLLGNGIKSSADNIDAVRSLMQILKIPVVTSMLAVDVPLSYEHYYGFIGAYGHRTANFVVAKSDLIISIGSRLDVRQVGAKRECFAPNAKIIRVDIDAGELTYPVHSNELQICCDAGIFVNKFISCLQSMGYSAKSNSWLDVCIQIKQKLNSINDIASTQFSNRIVESISGNLLSDSLITTDVGQNQVWIAQSLKLKCGQAVYFSGGHGAMGYSLPAAIGCYFGSDKTVYSFNGDGGIQMNIQELQTIARENIPVKIIILNNNSLGMIRHFQEMYFSGNYFQTKEKGGYTSPNFEKLSEGYGIKYYSISSLEDITSDKFEGDYPVIIEIKLPEDTYVFPKLEFGKPNHDQEPLIDRDIFEYLNSL